MNLRKIVFVVLRLAMGFTFLWAFLDKLFGLGFATVTAKAWINGGSPTYDFLTMATRGPFVEFFKSLAGSPIIDWLFMIGLLAVGLTLIFNRLVKWGAFAGGLMMLLMYLATLPPANNPIIDDHIIYILVLAVIGLRNRMEG